MGIMDILAQVAGSTNVNAQQFEQIAQQVPQNVVASGVASAFRANETPPIGEMVSNLFARSNGQQQAGMLNQILSSLGPGVAAGLGGNILGRLMGSGSTQITPEQAAQLSTQEVGAVVDSAHQANPGIADDLANYYAQHTGLIKTLGGAALAIALAKMKDHMGST